MLKHHFNNAAKYLTTFVFRGSIIMLFSFVVSCHISQSVLRPFKGSSFRVYSDKAIPHFVNRGVNAFTAPFYSFSNYYYILVGI
jgi:hypothetical protein